VARLLGLARLAQRRRTMMRALVLDGNLSFNPSYPDPKPARGESLVRVRMAGICGTDLELIMGYMAYRGVPGHEFVGEVAASGRPDLSGRRVTGEINAACGKCEACLAGLGRHCPKRTVLGILGRDGAFADYLCLPDENLVPVPDSVPDELAVFVEPIAAAYEILEQVRLAHNERIAVMGDGRLGAIVAMVLKAEGYDPLVGGHHSEKLARLSGLGLKVELEAAIEPGLDTVIDCTGSAEGFNRSLALVRPRGKLILKSTAATAAPINLAAAVVNEIQITGSRCGRFGSAMEALEAGKVDPRPLISTVYPLEKAAEAMAAAAAASNFKVLFKIS
jgi:threonine dehydrogenase-like Zn-dependent dehydrogenase